MNKFKPNQAYIGDGIYASYDGLQIWLAVNERENYVVALEPMTFAALVRYVESLHATLSKEPTVEDSNER